MSYSRICPYCGKETLDFFERTPTIDTLACRECKTMFSVKTSWGITQETILAWISVLTGVIALISFLGIHCIDDLKKCRFI